MNVRLQSPMVWQLVWESGLHTSECCIASRSQPRIPSTDNDHIVSRLLALNIRWRLNQADSRNASLQTLCFRP